MLEILYQDDHLVAINKPPGLLVHRSPMATDVEEFAVQTLRDQVGQRVNPVHRLDRKTSGVLLFAFEAAVNKKLMEKFASREMKKTYLAIVRGYTDDEGTIDQPLENNKNKVQDAVTHYKTLKRAELQVPLGKHTTSRYSLVEVKPETGRMHQIRKHFAHILHPIIGDRPHGCNKQNRLFKEKWDMTQMMLHAKSLEFDHPESLLPLKIEAGLHPEFTRMAQLMNFCELVP